MPSETTFHALTKKQFALWSHGYDSFISRLYFEPLYRRIGVVIASQITSDGSSLRLLDVACGTGEILVRLATAYPDLELTGTDFVPGMLARATKKNGAERIRRLSWCCAPKRSIISRILNAPSKSFSVASPGIESAILATNVL